MSAGEIYYLAFGKVIIMMEEDNIGQSGFPPYTRGPYASMYTGRPWTIRQYAGFSTAEESNQFYKSNLRSGQKGLSVAFDLPTHRGYDSDHPFVRGDVGKAGVAVDSVEDMKILFDGIPLDQISVSMTMNGAVIPVMAFYIVAAEEQGVTPDQLTGTIQNDILKEYLVRNTYIYPPESSMRIVSDIFRFTEKYMPRFNSISVSGYHMHEAGASAALEVAYTLADGLEYIRAGLNAGLEIDQFAPRISFFWGIGTDFFTEIAKLRAARRLWSELVSRFNPESKSSLRLRTHSQTSGWSLSAQCPYNNLTRTMIEAMAAAFGGTQSLHTNSYDEALALPSDHSARLARETQLYMQEKSGVTQAIDPWAGSGVIEDMTEQIYQDAKKELEEVEELGGMTKAIETGMPKNKIEAAAASRQAAIELKEFQIIGVNVLNVGEEAEEISIRKIDNRRVRDHQLEKMRILKKNRKENVVRNALKNLENSAADPSSNVLEHAVHAARARATLGEISLALEKVFGRYKLHQGIVQQVYGNHMKDNIPFQQAQELCRIFEGKYGRRPRILVAKLGQDGHDRGAKVIASSFADIGFDVDIGPMFQDPESVANQAIENDVHFLGISTLAGAHDSLVPELMEKLKDQNSEDIKVIVGGVIPADDYENLYAEGVYRIFGPGTDIVKAVTEILEEYIAADPSG